MHFGGYCASSSITAFLPTIIKTFGYSERPSLESEKLNLVERVFSGRSRAVADSTALCCRWPSYVLNKLRVG